jgi:RimJ/RimL family protein N-acetyltransferase
MYLVRDYHSVISQWVALMCDGEFPDPVISFGVLDEKDDSLVAGVTFYDHRGHSIMVAGAATSARWALNRQIMKELFEYPFVTLGCERMQSTVSVENRRSQRFTEGLGFRREGLLRRAYNGKDAILYGMLQDECPWLTETNHGWQGRRQQAAGDAGLPASAAVGSVRADRER